MNTDLQLLKQRCDLREVVARDLGESHQRGGRASLYKCPFHKEQNGYSLAVWADGFRCFGRCGVHGDVMDWIQSYHQVPLVDAVRTLSQFTSYPSVQPRPIPSHSPCQPPSASWQAQAREIAQASHELLWTEYGEGARVYLKQRGLGDAVLRYAGIGLVHLSAKSWQRWRLSVPPGILIPWFTDEQMWTLKVRRDSGIPKYSQVSGGNSCGLYNADAIRLGKPILFCEGEFDTLLVQQEAGDLITPVTLSSATASLSPHWLHLVAQQRIFIAYDRDEAGYRGARRLLRTLPQSRIVSIPHGNDISEMYAQAGDIRRWIESLIQTIPPQELSNGHDHPVD